MGANSAIICAMIFVFIAFRTEGPASMLLMGIALILQGQYWMHKDLTKLMETKDASLPHK